MRILVTGGLGLIGHNVVQKLERDGHDVVITAARRDFSFDPEIDIDEGFKIYYRWLTESVYWIQNL